MNPVTVVNTKPIMAVGASLSKVVNVNPVRTITQVGKKERNTSTSTKALALLIAKQESEIATLK